MKLTNGQKESIQWVMDICFNYITDDIDEAKKLTSALFNEVVNEIEKTEVLEFNNDDVYKALTRVLKHRIGIE